MRNHLPRVSRAREHTDPPSLRLSSRRSCDTLAQTPSSVHELDRGNLRTGNQDSSGENRVLNF
uniref:Uncharacterized protein n=1 Tax=Leersia perrieri TaxID=77586 RepID=A0A0D9XGX1_9ORYZ